MKGNAAIDTGALTEAARSIFNHLTEEQQEKLLALMEQLDKEDHGA